MPTVSNALEAEVAAIRSIRDRAAGRDPASRERQAIDRHFSRLLRLITPRIRHFTRAYGLIDMADDAAQACALGLHRAIETYDPARARFTTFVNWQLRGELQGLRFRMRPDRRDPARRIGAVTLSLDSLREDRALDLVYLEDAEALQRTEALAAATMARRACGRLLDEHFTAMRAMAVRQAGRRKAADEPGRIEAQLVRERAILAAHLTEADGLPDYGLSGEQRRQIVRRTLRALAARACGNPRYDPEAASAGERSALRH